MHGLGRLIANKYPEEEKPWHTRFGFRNLTPPRVNINVATSSRWLWSRIKTKELVVGVDVPADHIVSAYEAKASLQQAQSGSHDFITWLGHCAFLIRLGGVTLLTDPFLRGSLGPGFMSGFRRLPVMIDIARLSPDCILLSHAHYDHLHGPSLRALVDKSAQVICPLRVGKKVAKHGFRKGNELDWFEDLTLADGVKITALPAHHYSEPYFARSLWASFKIEAGGKTIYFGGDTGYSAIFRDHIAQHGPFDLALIGVGCYQLDFPGEQASVVHTNPGQALKIAKEVGARRVIGMHWGTGRMTDDDQMQIPGLVKEASIEAGIPADTMRIGETRIMWQ